MKGVLLLGETQTVTMVDAINTDDKKTFQVGGEGTLVGFRTLQFRVKIGYLYLTDGAFAFDKFRRFFVLGVV